MARRSPHLGELCAALGGGQLRARQPRPGHRRRRAPPALAGLGSVPRGTRLPAAVAPLCPGAEAAQRPAQGRARDGAARCLGPRAGRRRRAADPPPPALSGALQPVLRPPWQPSWLPALGRDQPGFQPGWRRDELPLADALLLARDRDLAAGSRGRPASRRLASRLRRPAGARGAVARPGQADRAGLLLAQAELHAALARRLAGVRAWTTWPRNSTGTIRRGCWQRLLASRRPGVHHRHRTPPGWQATHGRLARFHVEHGGSRPSEAERCELPSRSAPDTRRRPLALGSARLYFVHVYLMCLGASGPCPGRVAGACCRMTAARARPVARPDRPVDPHQHLRLQQDHRPARPGSRPQASGHVHRRRARRHRPAPHGVRSGRQLRSTKPSPATRTT